MVAVHDAANLRCAVAFVSKHKDAKVAHKNQMPVAFWAEDVRDCVAVALGQMLYIFKVLFPWRHLLCSNAARSAYHSFVMLLSRVLAMLAPLTAAA